MRHAAIRFGTILALGAPLALAPTLGCKEPPPPGEAVGTFLIAGTLTENTCGAGFVVETPISFRAEVRREAGTAYWRMDGDRVRVPGTIDGSGSFHFRSDALVEGWAADEVNGIPACRFTQLETIDGVLARGGPSAADASAIGGDDAGVGAGAASSFEATNVITIGVAAGYDCSLALESSGIGGQFPALPCRATYTLSGRRVE